MIAGGAAQEFGGLRRITKWNQVTQGFESREKFDGVALIFNDVVAVQLFQVESRAEEMIVVNEREIHSSGRKARRELWLPNSLGKPCTTRSGREMFLNVISQPSNLLVTIIVRDGDKDGLVKSPADDFHLAAFHKCAQMAEIFWMGALKPFEERSSVVQAQANRRVAREYLEKRQIGFLVRGFEHIVEIADRLMRVNNQNQLEFRHRYAPMQLDRIT
jgi:hypothetical protein